MAENSALDAAVDSSGIRSIDFGGAADTVNALAIVKQGRSIIADTASGVPVVLALQFRDETAFN